MTDDELDTIEARVNHATPGPWWVQPERTVRGETYDAFIAFGEQGDPSETYDLYDLYNVETDYTFIAAARSDVPTLVAEVRRLRAALEAPERRRVE